MVERADTDTGTDTDTISRAAISASGAATTTSTDPRNYAYSLCTYITCRFKSHITGSFSTYITGSSIAVYPLKYRVAGVEHSETLHGIHNTLYTSRHKYVRNRKTPASSDSGSSTRTTTTDTNFSYASRSNPSYNV